MKTVVIYKSKTGFARKYAEWIAEELSADIFEASKVTADLLKTYDNIIYGAGLYVVGINGIKFITRNLDKLKDKKLAVFATGVTPYREKDINEVKNKNFTLEEQKYIQFFYLRGGFDYNKLKPFDKVLMTLLKWKLKSKNKLTPDERGMLAAYDNPIDFTKKSYTDQLVSYINSKS